MTSLKISADDWKVIRFKITRKYNTLSEEDLAYVEGEEEQLVQRLAKRIRRNADYVRFTLGKELQDIHTNRL
ncbi:hypothetical protein [Sphingobacterium corticibacter]|uniref:General stress protein CsbD n=1 Tax=Sphingobacterium corticibacter TaxID=2171749 RepID=A0A2T8HHK0_9SPHI|nr:hypothetical protein [Sphingobacterium corticibacter]PVH24918.1 hypothetical protein DC487_12455 [Sphingobacterium corticibacter]